MPLTALALALTLALAQSPADSGASTPAPAEVAEPLPPKRVRLVFAGVRGELKDNIARAVELKGLIRRYGASDALVERAYRKAPEQIRAALQPFGYYDPQITSTFERDAGTYRIRFQVDPGPATRVTELALAVDGPAGSDPAIRAAIEDFEPGRGDVLVHADYESGKATIQRLLQASGYFDARLEAHRVEVRKAEAAAAIQLRWTSGERYTFGPTTFEPACATPDPDSAAPEPRPDCLLPLDPAILERYRVYIDRAPYDQAQLLEMQQRLTDADYFSSIEIEVDPETAVERAVPVTVRLTPAKRNVFTGGVSYGTDSGAGVRAGVDRRYVNRRGHKLAAQGEYSQKLQAAAVSYRMPRVADFRSFYGVTAQLRDEQTDTFETQTLRLSGEFVDVWQRWVRTASLNFLTGDFTVGGRVEDGGERGSSTFLYPELRLQRREADDLLLPRHGWSAILYLRAGAEGLVSDTNLVQLGGEGRFITSLDERQRLLFRGALGATWTDDFSKLPPDLRYYAGGDLSVRGYGYQDLGPVNGNGRVIGGRYLLTASAEYEYALNDQWAVAGFTDAGNAYDSGQFEPEIGVGFGVRWRSPVGLVRLDLAFPVDDFGAPRPHLVIGPDL